MHITDTQQIHTYYQALLDRKQDYVGIFYAGVKTTSIFCIATCRARKPKPENVQFYRTFKSAMDAGFRPCKICKPTENANQAPAKVAQAIQMMRAQPKEKVKDYHLRQAGISPEQVRRWFKQHYGMTFQAYQRMYRINQAFQELKTGKRTTDTAFDTGYESLSGFGYTYKKIVGSSPQKSLDQGVILISRLTTPLGPMFACATDKGICLLEFVDRRMLETEFATLQKRIQAPIIIGENEHLKQVKKELNDYFSGKLKTFKVALDTPGTAFQRSVWEGLSRIPYGQTMSYQELAQKLGKEKGARAVANANGHNRVAIIVPCHRVIGKNGNLTGYGGGLERKAWLLRHEGVL